MASLFKQTAVTQRQGFVYPERVILANLSHGSITVKKDGNEKTFVMPEGISVKRAWASVPGVCNFVDPETNAYFVRTIQSSKGRLETIPFENVDNEFKVLLNTFKKYDREDTLEPLKSVVKNKDIILAKEIGVETEEEKNDYVDQAGKYINTYDNFFKLSTYLPGERVIDKLYTRTNTEAANTPSERSWVTLLVNVEPGSLDLLTLMRPQTRGGTLDIYLSEIINFLKDKGVKEVILFDNSCSVFLDEDGTEYLDRSIRVRRNNIVNRASPGKFGGKTKKRRRQKRTKNKNKKRKTSKRF
jgi:hypothetical protein